MAPGRLWGFDYWVFVQLVSSPVHGFGSQIGNWIHFSISVFVDGHCQFLSWDSGRGGSSTPLGVRWVSGLHGVVGLGEVEGEGSLFQ